VGSFDKTQNIGFQETLIVYVLNCFLVIIIEVADWFEERETAAKGGRPIFGQMLRLLKQGKADGIVIHKIDRGARNLKDWANLGELIDQNIDIHFANESLDLRSRGGRLSADIQAVVAADFIRNLREETRKGFYGRLKQGFYPLPAPLGYLDQGSGKHKIPDPQRSPLIRQAFELYATGQYSIRTLTQKLHDLGLRNINGAPVTKTGVDNILNNPFYAGIMYIKTTGERFPGGHDPLVRQAQFDRVQAILHGKTNTVGQRHDFLFRRRIRCQMCGNALIAERQKGHVYYRCQTRTCPMTCIREELIESAIRRLLEMLTLSEAERRYLHQEISKMRRDSISDSAALTRSLKLQLSQLGDRLARLTDALLDGTIDKPLFEERKSALLAERRRMEDKLGELEQNGQSHVEQIEDILELVNSAHLAYEMGIAEEKRRLLDTITSNRTACRESVEIELHFPFNAIAGRSDVPGGSH